MNVRDGHWKKSACILCECNCGIEVQLDDANRLVRFRGDKQHPASQGYACEKPHRLDHYQNSPDRIHKPLRRRPDGTFEEVSWQTALEEIAARARAIAAEHGEDTLFYYGGGGQGNHFPGMYATATRAALGIRHVSNALAQEKTGEAWVAGRMLGAYTRADFEHCQVAMFLGKNPWQSHSIHRARTVLREIASDPGRTLIVVDPRRTESAELADIHLQVRAGTDAFALLGILAILVKEGLVDLEFIAKHTAGWDDVTQMLEASPHSLLDDCAARTGVPRATLELAARAIGNAKSFASFEDLGVQMSRHSTLVSYLHRLIWLCTGNFGKPGSHYVPTALGPLWGDLTKERQSPVTGARVVGGLVPCNVIAEEILADHPKRYRGMIVEAVNPAHSLADSKVFRQAFQRLDLLVVIDVAMTETAELAHYVLPAATQFEKAEATFFNLDFPKNYFHVRQPLVEPPEGPLPEAEIHSRLCEILGAVGDADYIELRAAAAQGLERYLAVFMSKVALNPRLMRFAPVIAYRTLGPELPAGMAQAAPILGLAVQAAMKQGASLARAGFVGPPLAVAVKLFETVLASSSGFVFAVDEWDEQLARVRTPIALALPDLLTDAALLTQTPTDTSDEYPFVLCAGERRSFTANTILRDPTWRKKDAAGALRMSPADATRLSVATGDSVTVTTRRGSATVVIEVSDTMQEGHLSLPNGLGTSSSRGTPGVALNELTALQDRDPYSDIPWHKYVRARVTVV